MKSTALCLLASLIVNYTFSQEKISELDPVTITTSINPEKASQTGRSLLVIKGERFANLPIHSVDELLRYLPGIEVQARGPMGAQSDIVIRGGTFQQVLILIDGLRLNDPNSGHFGSYYPISPAEIDRIEVLKGASSAVYGSEASRNKGDLQSTNANEPSGIRVGLLFSHGHSWSKLGRKWRWYYPSLPQPGSS